MSLFRSTTVLAAIVLVGCAVLSASALAAEGSREFRASSGGTLTLDLRAGATVKISGDGGSSISVRYSTNCTPECKVEFDERRGGLKVATHFVEGRDPQQSDIDLEIRVPRHFDIELDSVGGSLSIDGVEGRFTGETRGGGLFLHDVRGEARLKTMGGKIELTRSELDGTLKTMGGEVLFRDVVGDVEGSSMGGNVRYKNVQRRGGKLGSPPRTGDLDEIDVDTVQISTMGGKIEVEDAPEGADVHTMGGNIWIENAERFVRAKTMGGDIRIASVDGWVEAVTMAGDVDVTVTGRGGDVELSSNSGDITLTVPAGFGMRLDLQVAFTRNSSKEYTIETPGRASKTVSRDWDYGHGTPRKYIRVSESINGSGGSGNTVTIRTINGNITVREGR